MVDALVDQGRHVRADTVVVEKTLDGAERSHGELEDDIVSTLLD